MKANEFMIGDFLKWKEQPGFNDEDRNMILRVKNILDDAIKIDGRFELYHISLFKPIPLTPEILEKNGFKVDTIMNGACYYYNKKVVNDIFHRIDEAVRIDVFAKSAKAAETGLILLQIGYPDDCNKQISVEIRYVHELQHALKLCEIEKEIKL